MSVTTFNKINLFCRDPTEYQSITNHTAKRPCSSLERPAVSCDSDWNCTASMEGLAAGNIEGATARHEDGYEGSDNLIGENEKFQDEYEYEESDNRGGCNI